MVPSKTLSLQHHATLDLTLQRGLHTLLKFSTIRHVKGSATCYGQRNMLRVTSKQRTWRLERHQQRRALGEESSRLERQRCCSLTSPRVLPSLPARKRR